VTATCSGTTTNQGAGAPGTSGDPSGSGYGSGVEAGVTVNVVAGSGNTVTGTTYGLFLGDATVTNNASASIAGGSDGVFAANGTANVSNFGSITGTSNIAIYAFTNATVTNNAGASISGANGIYANTGVANVTNFGSIFGSAGYGIFAGSDTTVTNNTGASISGVNAGIYSNTGSATIANFGSITGTAGFGIQAATNATVTNNVGASVNGINSGISTGTGFANIANFGSIVGTGGYGIYAGSEATVTNNAGATISGSSYGIFANSGGSSVSNAGTINGGTASIQFAGAGNILTLAPGSAITGNVVGTGSDTFQLGGSGSATFDVSQIGAAAQYQGFGTFNKVSNSTWTLTGASTFLGPINVNGGTLSVNGDITSASGVTVNAGGTLAGTGAVGNTLVLGGAFAPGSGMSGSGMTVSGTLGFNAGATYVVNINPSTSSSASVSGPASLGGATVNASFVNGSYISKQYAILSAASISGTFGTLTNSNLPSNFTDTVSYDATHAYLNLTLSFTAAPNFGNGLNANQNSVGNALINYFNMTGGIPMVYSALSAYGLSQASGQPGASTAQTGITEAGQFVDAVFGGAFDENENGDAKGFVQQDERSGYAMRRRVSPEARDAYAAVTLHDRVGRRFSSRWNVWASAYGGNSRIKGDAGVGSNATTSSVFGSAVGATYRFTPDTQAGFALGGAGSSFSLDGSFGGGKADVFNAAIYAKHTIGAAYLAGLLGYSWQDTSTDRMVTVAGTDGLHASFKAQALVTRLESGWRYAAPLVGVSPYAALQTITFYLPAYGETTTLGSNAFALSYASKTVSAPRGELGAKFDKAMQVENGEFTLKTKTAWVHNWNTDRSASATFQTLPGAAFIVKGAQPSPNAILASLGGEIVWHNGWSMAASFDGEFSRDMVSYAGKGSVKYGW
jgi:uncharacterized protein with beta-barrel porin domain